jgi:hypothetical protein
MARMHFVWGNTAVTNGCADRALSHNFSALYSEIISAAEQPGRNDCHTGINGVH